MKSVRLFFLCVVVVLSGCTSKQYSAPVSDAFNTGEFALNHYRVRVGDTLYSIAWSFNFDYLHLAQLNNLSPPYRVRIGQLLRLNGSANHPIKKTTTIDITEPMLKQSIKSWRWPAVGQVVAGFSESPYGNKGIDIHGEYGEDVHSVANGVVVYSGAGVRGYGNLIIIKHNKDFLSAYAFNQRNLTKEGMKVQSGQKIATMGRNNSGAVLLHFELRRKGHPVDPLTYLR